MLTAAKRAACGAGAAWPAWNVQWRLHAKLLAIAMAAAAGRGDEVVRAERERGGECDDVDREARGAHEAEAEELAERLRVVEVMAAASRGMETATTAPRASPPTLRC